MARYFIHLSYVGTAYNGWQNQPHVGTKTVQSTIESALSLFLGQEMNIVGCGRTDTGVHAQGYYAHIDIESVVDIPHLIYRANKILPMDIAIHDILLVKDNAHTRFDAVSRSYQYHLHTSKWPFAAQSFYYTYDRPDIDLLNQAAAVLMQYEDFTTFCKLHTDVKTMICRVTESQWSKQGDHYIYRITSDRFLRGMIRLIVGMCLNVARGKLSIDDVHHAMKDQKRLPYDWSVPAEGLCLCDIRYPYL
ncbi:MAG: tRNA pseudouridine(38-40) synthase TruA [Saprospiraceae bacterium]